MMFGALEDGRLTGSGAAVQEARYDVIGAQYAATRREDPRIAAQIQAALGQARTIVNVGAGTGSYEPRDRRVIAVEPSEVMIAQRDPSLPPAIRSGACPLPLEDRSVDAAMAILTIHHWDEDQEQGVREMRRVARGPVVILTFDPEVSARMWLIADYVPEVAELDRRIFPTRETLAGWLDAEVDVQEVPISRDSPDWMLGSFWAHPERVLDEQARNSTSGFARMPPDVVNRVVKAVERDLQDGTWDARHGHLRRLDEYDAGLRLLVSNPT
jgi:SAM-dependent methyltransferase